MSYQHLVESKKKIIALSFFIGLFLFVGSVNADTWWDSNYEKRANVTINNTDNSNALTNYQVFVNVTYDDDMQTDFDDLRFIDDDDSTELDYWIENNVSSSYADVWINVSSIPASDTKDIIMYYGNSTVSTTGNATNTFILYDDFLGSNVNTAKWDVTTSGSGTVTVSDGYLWTTTTANSLANVVSDNTIGSINIIMESNMSTNFSVNTFNYIGMGGVDGFTDNHTAFNIKDDNEYYTVNRKDGSDVGGYTLHAGDTLSFHNWTFVYINCSQDVQFYVDGVSKANNSNVACDDWKASIGEFFDNSAPTNVVSMQTDWIRFRQYTSPVPTYSIGEEETYTPPIPPEVCIQHYLEKNVYILLCNVTSISHNQNYCVDNVTLLHNITYTINDTEGQFDRLEYCLYGCNNESLECNPAPYEVNLWILAGIFAVMFIIITLLKLLRLI